MEAAIEAAELLRSAGVAEPIRRVGAPRPWAMRHRKDEEPGWETLGPLGVAPAKSDQIAAELGVLRGHAAPDELPSAFRSVAFYDPASANFQW